MRVERQYNMIKALNKSACVSYLIVVHDWDSRMCSMGEFLLIHCSIFSNRLFGFLILNNIHYAYMHMVEYIFVRCRMAYIITIQSH